MGETNSNKKKDQISN